jgi:hypothetical protein
MKAYAVRTHKNTLSIMTSSCSSVNAHFDEISNIKYANGCFLVFLNDGKVAKFEVPESIKLVIVLQLAGVIKQRALYMRTRKSYREQFSPCDEGCFDKLKEWGVRV